MGIEKTDELIILIAKVEQAASDVIDLLIERGMTEQEINEYFLERLEATKGRIRDFTL